MDKKITPPPPAGRIARRWILFLTIFHLLPTPWYMGVAAGLAPASFLTTAGLAALFNIESESMAFALMLGGPGLIGLLISLLAAYLLAALIGRLKRPLFRTLSLLAIIAVSCLATLKPIYIYGGHSGGDAFGLLDFIDILSQFRIPEIASIIYFSAVILLTMLLLLYQQAPQMFPTLPFDHLIRKKIIRRSCLLGIILFFIVLCWTHRLLFFVKPLADLGFASAQYHLAMAIKDQPGASGSYRQWLEQAAAQGHTEAAMALARSPKSAEDKIHWLTFAAENGLAEAQFELYRLLMRRSPSTEDTATAKKWLLAAAELGHGEAQYEFGRLLARGDQSLEIDKDIEAARTWWERAAENSNGRAMEDLALRYENGTDGFPRDADRAINLRLKIADGYKQGLYGLPQNKQMAAGNLSQATRISDFEQQLKEGNPETLGTLGRQLLQASGAARTTQDEGLELLERAAAAGSAEQQYEVGAIFMFGSHGIEKDFARGRRWWDQAAASNHVRTLTYLAPAYQNGQYGYPVNLLKSKELTAKLVEAYRDGRAGVDPDPERHQYWSAQLKYFDRLFDLAGGDYLPLDELRQQAEQGIPAAQYQLGRQMLVSGAKRDRTLGLQWIEKAAAGGLAEAQYRLVSYYENRLHIMQRNPDRGIALLESASRQNHLPAMAMLAIGYHKGRYSLKQDYRKAKDWYEKLLEAYDSGDYQGELNEHFIEFQTSLLGYVTKALTIQEEKDRHYEQASLEERKVIEIGERYHKMYEKAVNKLNRSDGSQTGKEKFRAEVQRLLLKYQKLRDQEIERMGN